MLSLEDNKLVTQTGPGTPMGEYLRRFWIPVLLANELPEADCPPVRAKVLGEKLVAFKDTDGKLGLVDEFCAHRRASLFFGRNEECGLRCVYHGWKYDVDGDCVDMPSEPEESNFKDKIKITAYPAREWGGMIWAYMGPRELMPELPEMEWALVPESHRRVSRRLQENNYLQGIEGGIDSSHVAFLHAPVDPERQLRGSQTIYMYRDRAPRFDVQETDYGFVYGAKRNAEEDSYYWRITPFLLPFFTIIPGPLEDADKRTYSGHGWIPADDENCWMFTYSWNPSRPLREDEGHGASFLELEPGTLRATFNKDNNYGIDREMQRTVNYTGIANGSVQDAGIQESMGPIVDRSQEHLGTTDAAIIYLRRMYLRAARDLLEGAEPFVPRRGSAYRVRSVSAVLDRKVTFDEGRAYVEIPQK